MSRIIITLVLLCLISQSCSTDDNENSSNVLTEVLIITYPGAAENIYQINVKNGMEVSTINLSDELGLPGDTSFYGQNFNPTISFYAGAGNGLEFRLWEKNVDTNSIDILDIVCDLDIGEYPFSLTSTEDYAFELTSDSDGVSFFLNVRIYNRNTNVCEKVVISELINNGLFSKNPIKVGNYLYVYHQGPFLASAISKINLSNATVENRLEFESPGAATIRNNSLLFFEASSDSVYYEYDLDTFELLETNNLDQVITFNSGMFNSTFQGESMLIYLAQPQPSVIEFNPALVDLNSGTVTFQIDMYTVLENLYTVYPNTSIQFISEVHLDVANEMLIGGFSILSGPGDPVYAIFYSDYEGNILNHVPIDHRPYRILIR